MGKTTTRLPESLSYGHSPFFTSTNPSQTIVDGGGISQVYSMNVPEGDNNLAWTINKMGQNIDPCNVVLNGSQYVHGIDKGVQLLNKAGQGLLFLSLDVPTVLIGTDDHVDSPFPVPLQPLPCSSVKIMTMSFNIYNNIWNTNYIYWYPYENEDADFKARFAIRFKN
ncbi:coiled-coil domain-containing protein 90b, mitochondrial [Plakobranchus ocellatus]|uniref:Coiled-coil domain-containing protein 90b, mitochondrial n=1 Tax=Plakobranchus ocellatus TaxID=259542 RepID=A0AAV4DNI0_9GAST|nr:coiled-coil domain-containing protein 90b, mitochondrial [Plakobranchus ocellatus]